MSGVGQDEAPLVDCGRRPPLFSTERIKCLGGRQRGGLPGGRFEHFRIFGNFSGRFSGTDGPPQALGWPETDSPRKMMASSGVEIEIGALGTRFVATFRLYVKAKKTMKTCD